MTRTDIHAPKSINPAEYQLVGYLVYPRGVDISAFEFARAMRDVISKHMAMTGGSYSTHDHGGQCMICGNSLAIDMGVFYHAATNTYLKVGLNCAEKLNLGNATTFKAWRKERTDWTAFQTGKKRAQLILADLELTRAWDVFNATNAIYTNNRTAAKEDVVIVDFEERTITDIVGKLIQYGNISDNQINFIKRLLSNIDIRPQVEAKKAAEREAAADCPEGRIEIVGEVLSTRTEDTPFGIARKMLVKADSGFKVWGSIPSSIDDGQIKGLKVKFTATVERSKDDSKFGFFKRPTKASIEDAA